ncbi:helix-turn-helix transcriptional regulator [Aquirufa sp. 5-AUSEE-100C1]|jgi:transcriptional regulator with XRE-family HTH domain
MKLKKEELVVKIGTKIREKRIEKGLSIEKLANEAEIESKQLRRIELGEINTSIYQIYNITHTLAIPMRDIFIF